MHLGSFRDSNGAGFVGELDGETIHPLRAESMLAWLAGDGREREGAPVEAAEVEVRAPVPHPPSVRDFYAFEEHVRAGWRRRGGEIPEYWYDAPAFYFSNPASIHGPQEPVRCPPGLEELDFELEIAAVIGAGEQIAGFTLMNDWSARGIQAREVTVGLGPHKAKDFATSLGPLIVTAESLPLQGGRLALEASVEVNGAVVARASAHSQHFTWEELVAQASKNTRLRPGDVLGSGTLPGGCLWELGPLPAEAGGDGRRWLEPGDVVALEAEGLGRLESTLAPA
jgi:fumarylacetoacetate (FAA) hydrolase